VYKIRTPVQLSSEDDVARMMDFIDELESNDDVLGVFAGFDYN
jgi:transcriptional/translational regulatory protein YebC/TACO1